jgi:hypothetical protein
MNIDTFNHADRSGFVERLGRLSGSTTWREPGGGGYVPFVAGSMTADNALNLALAMARRSTHDIGPDIAYTIGTGQAVRMEAIISAVAAHMLLEGGPAMRKAEAFRNILARHAYELVGFGRPRTRLPRRLPLSWDKLKDAATGWLWIQAEIAIERAEFAEHRDGNLRRACTDEMALQSH